jgi:hypothetical protein
MNFQEFLEEMNNHRKLKEDSDVKLFDVFGVVHSVRES